MNRTRCEKQLKTNLQKTNSKQIRVNDHGGEKKEKKKGLIKWQYLYYSPVDQFYPIIITELTETKYV